MHVIVLPLHITQNYSADCSWATGSEGLQITTDGKPKACSLDA